MTSPASLTPRNGKSLLPVDGGTLARDHSRAAFLFPEQFKKLHQIVIAGRGFPPFPQTGTGAARWPVDAKSRPLPFSEVNHVSHVDGFLSVGRTEHNPGSFA